MERFKVRYEPQLGDDMWSKGGRIVTLLGGLRRRLSSLYTARATAICYRGSEVTESQTGAELPFRQ